MRINPDLSLAALVFVLLSIFYYQTAPRYLSDFKYMGAAAQSLWSDGDLSVDELAFEPGAALPYQLARGNGRIYHRYPNANALVIAPLAGIFVALDVPIVDDAGSYHADREARLLHSAAALGTAAIVAVLYLLAAQLVDRKAALCIALAAALATPLWSTGAGTLWSHTFSGLMLASALLAIVRADRLGSVPNGPLLGSLIAWMFFFRPTLSISVAALLVYVFWRWRLRAMVTIVVSALWLVLFMAHSQWQWGSPVPPYFHGEQLRGWPYGEALLGHLFSPARGLFVYIPAMAWLGALLFHTWRRLPLRPLVVTGLAAGGVHWWIVSSSSQWWGGHCWGPRMLMDLVPWWVVMASAGWSALGSEGTDALRPVWIHPGIAAALVAVAIGLNAVGVLVPASVSWNPDVDIDAHPERVWDWERAPFMHWRTRALARAAARAGADTDP